MRKRKQTPTSHLKAHLIPWTLGLEETALPLEVAPPTRLCLWLAAGCVRGSHLVPPSTAVLHHCVSMWLWN